MQKGLPEPDVTGPPEPFLRRELDLLELLLADPELRALRLRSPLHPAVILYDNISAFLAKTTGLSYPDETGLALDIGRILLDASLSDSVLRPDDILRSIGNDEEVLQQLRRRVANPKQFQDQMAAIAVWSLLRAKGMAPRLVEKEGLPDLAVPISCGETEWIEVKRIRRGSSPTRARKIIKKANSQIKRAASNSAGVVFMLIERPQHCLVFDDALPSEVKLYVDEIERELASGCSRSVAAVVIGWDDYMLVGDYPEPTLYVHRRRTGVRRHRTPRRALRLPRTALELGRTIILPIVWPAPSGSTKHLASIRIENINATQLFRQECELPGHVRSVHAAAALRNPDALVEYELGGMSILLATKWITAPKVPYNLLLIGQIREAGIIELVLGFRVYGEDLPAHPLEVFMAFLRRYGLPVTVGEQHGLFIPRATVALQTAEGSELIRASAPKDEPAIVSYVVRINSSQPPTADVAWAFGIAIGRYRADVKRYQR